MNLNTSVKSLHQLLNTFGQFSGYKTNNNKSALLLLNKEEREYPTIHTQFVLAPDGFTSLGIKITPDVENIISVNYDPLVKNIIEMLDRWSSLPISMLGRINIIKMLILPQFLYLFQTIPPPLPASFFSTLRKNISCFIWNNKHPRLRLNLLHLPYDQGGLKLPNMKLYYWAAQLQAAMFYFLPDEVPAWVEIEKDGIKLPIHIYLYSSQAKKLKKNTHNPFLRNTITIWYEARALIDQNITFSYFTPFLGNAGSKNRRLIQ